MIARLIVTAKDIIFRNKKSVLLTKPWRGRESVGDIQSALLEKETLLTPIQKGIVNSFLESLNVSSETPLASVLKSSEIDLTKFIKKVEKWGYLESQVLGALSLWISESEKIQLSNHSKKFNKEYEQDANILPINNIANPRGNPPNGRNAILIVIDKNNAQQEIIDDTIDDGFFNESIFEKSIII